MRELSLKVRKENWLTAGKRIKLSQIISLPPSLMIGRLPKNSGAIIAINKAFRIRSKPHIFHQHNLVDEFNS